MSDIRSYLKYKEQRENKEDAPPKDLDFKTKLKRHKFRNIAGVLAVLLFLGAGLLAGSIYLNRKVYTDYTVKSSVERQVIEGTETLELGGRLLTYSKDGVNCSDLKGNVLWNKTYEMQNPIVTKQGSTAAIGDYNGRKIYLMDNQAFLGEIDTNLPIRNLAVSTNNLVAAVLDDASLTWIYLYDAAGNELVHFKTSMKNSGYPVSLSLSPNGELAVVSYLYVDNGEIKSSVAFYNFGPVGKNVTDNFMGGYDFADTIVPFVAFMNSNTVFAVADDRIMFYTVSQEPTSASDSLFEEEVHSVYYSEKYVGLVYANAEGDSRYRLDIYGASGGKVLSKPFNIEYTDILFHGDTFIIHNETEWMVCSMDGTEKYNGSFKNSVYTVIPGKSVSKYVLVTQKSLQSIELQ